MPTSFDPAGHHWRSPAGTETSDQSHSDAQSTHIRKCHGNVLYVDTFWHNHNLNGDFPSSPHWDYDFAFVCILHTSLPVQKNTPQGRWLGAAETNQVITGSQEALKQQETWNFKIKEGTLDPGRGCRTWTRSSFCFKVEDLRYSSIVHPRDHYHTLLHVCLHEKGWDSEVNRCVYIKHTGSVSTGPFVNSRDTVNRKRWGGRGHPVFNPVGRECVHVRTEVRDQTTVMPYSPSWCSSSSANTCVIWRRFHSTCGS